MGLQHITSTVSALPRFEEYLLPHFISVGSSHSLVLNPRPDLMGSSPFRNSFCPAFTFRVFGVLRFAAFWVHYCEEWHCSIGEAWVSSREREKHCSHVIYFFFLPAVAAVLSGNTSFPLGWHPIDPTGLEKIHTFTSGYRNNMAMLPSIIESTEAYLIKGVAYAFCLGNFLGQYIRD